MDGDAHGDANGVLNGDLTGAMNEGMDGAIDDMELPSDPDAQATVTDFLDFTDYLPSDMMRSLTLIGDLNQKSMRANTQLGQLSRTHGELPTLDAARRPEPSNLRADISDQLNRAVHTRTLAQAEANRMAANVDRHYQKLLYIQTKLEGLFDAFPAAQEELKATNPSISPKTTSTRKIMLRLGDNGGRKDARIKRGPRITIPGKVLAPNEFDYEAYESDNDALDTLDDEIATPKPARRRTSNDRSRPIKLKVPKPRKTEKTLKPPRPPRAPGLMGTNVHSQVAGISTSNALAKLHPPPGDAPVGSEHKPWGRLTQFELAKLRKRMKKNAVWQPSTTMINRELSLLERSLSHYRAAKADAEAAGQSFIDKWETYASTDTPSDVPVVEEPVEESQDLPIINKGMKLNEQKKAKKESLAKLAAVDAEGSGHKPPDSLQITASSPDTAVTEGERKARDTEATTVLKPTSRKRKRESVFETEVANAHSGISKATPALAPASSSPIAIRGGGAEIQPRSSQPSATSRLAVPQPRYKATTAEPLAAETPVSTTTPNGVVSRPSSPKKSPTPILPPTKEKRALEADAKKLVTGSALSPAQIAMPTSASTRSHRSAMKNPTPAPDTTRKVTSAPGQAVASSRRTTSRGKSASVESNAVSLSRDRPRRTSTVHNIPAPESSRRAKRPAPGPVTAGEEGSASISVGKRTAAPRKKTTGKKVQKDETMTPAHELDIEVDENEVPIDPNEPRYCICNRVSYGEMVACENQQVCPLSFKPYSQQIDLIVDDQCPHEWFHLSCVNLTIETLPSRTTKWYCFDCRAALGIDEKGKVSRAKRKK